MAIEGVLTRQKCAVKWCATFWVPVSPNLISLNREVFNCYDFRHCLKVTASPNGHWTSKLVLEFSSKTKGLRSGGLRRKYILKSYLQKKMFWRSAVSSKIVICLCKFVQKALVGEPGFFDFHIFSFLIIEIVLFAIFCWNICYWDIEE